MSELSEERELLINLILLAGQVIDNACERLLGADNVNGLAVQFGRLSAAADRLHLPIADIKRGYEEEQDFLKDQ